MIAILGLGGLVGPFVMLASEKGKHSVTSGDPTSVVFSAPLHGGSLDGWVTGLAEARDRFKVFRFCRGTNKGAALPTGRQAQGFSEDHTGPFACYFSTFDRMVTEKGICLLTRILIVVVI